MQNTPPKEVQFLAELSHELKTPISILIGYLDTLSDGAWRDTAVAPQFIQKALAQAQRLAHLVQDVLFLAQVEQGRWVLSLEPVSLQGLTEELFGELEALAQSKKIRLSIEAQDHNTAVEADPTALRLVLKNLIENAIQYSPEGRRVWVFWTMNGEWVRIGVRDEGEGIAPEHLPHIFERFYRVDKSRSRQSGGTGLGLTLVKELLAAHGSTIQVESQVGQGSVFWFTFKLSA